MPATPMFRRGQQVIERTGLGDLRQDREVIVTEVSPAHVKTSTGLLYTAQGMSASRDGANYRSIRAMAYATVNRPGGATGAAENRPRSG